MLTFPARVIPPAASPSVVSEIFLAVVFTVPATSSAPPAVRETVPAVDSTVPPCATVKSLPSAVVATTLPLPEIFAPLATVTLPAASSVTVLSEREATRPATSSAFPPSVPAAPTTLTEAFAASGSTTVTSRAEREVSPVPEAPTVPLTISRLSPVAWTFTSPPVLSRASFSPENFMSTSPAVL